MKRIVLCAAVFFSMGSSQFAAPLTYEFSGSVLEVEGAPFGLSPALGTGVSGTFTYDPESPGHANPLNPNFKIYPQDFPLGFSAQIGEIPVVAKNYSAAMQLNADTGLFVADTFWIINDYNPAAPTLSVGGVDVPDGLFSVDLINRSPFFSDTSPSYAVGLSL